MQAIYVAGGTLLGLALVYLLARVALRHPSRSTRREESTWDDTNHTSGGGGGPY